MRFHKKKGKELMILTQVNIFDGASNRITFEQVYSAALMGAASELLAYAILGVAFETLGMKKTFMLSFSISTVGAIFILTVGLQNQGSIWFPVFFLLTNCGISIAYNLIIVANSTLFEVSRAATAFGIASFMARLV